MPRRPHRDAVSTGMRLRFRVVKTQLPVRIQALDGIQITICQRPGAGDICVAQASEERQGETHQQQEYGETNNASQHQGQVTSEDMSYTVADLAIGDAAVKAFTGDTLFVGDVAPQ